MRNPVKINTDATRIGVAVENLVSELNAYKYKFEIEKNIKNNLYSFILSKGLFHELSQFELTRNMGEDNHPAVAMKVVSSLLQPINN